MYIRVHVMILICCHDVRTNSYCCCCCWGECLNRITRLFTWLCVRVWDRLDVSLDSVHYCFCYWHFYDYLCSAVGATVVIAMFGHFRHIPNSCSILFSKTYIYKIANIVNHDVYFTDKKSASLCFNLNILLSVWRMHIDLLVRMNDFQWKKPCSYFA